jgi:hypothetical protein
MSLYLRGYETSDGATQKILSSTSVYRVFVPVYVVIDCAIASVQLRWFIRRLYQVIERSSSRFSARVPTGSIFSDSSTPKSRVSSPTSHRQVSVLNETAEPASDLKAPVESMHGMSAGSEASITVHKATSVQLSVIPQDDALEVTFSDEKHRSQSAIVVTPKRMKVVSNRQSEDYKLAKLAARISILAVVSMMASFLTALLLNALGRLAFTLDMVTTALCVYYCFSISNRFSKLCFPIFHVAKRCGMPIMFWCCHLTVCECDSVDCV